MTASYYTGHIFIQMVHIWIITQLQYIQFSIMKTLYLIINVKLINIIQSFKLNSSNKGKYTYEIIRKVHCDYICKNQVLENFLTSHDSFLCFLHKINEKTGPTCEYGKLENVFPYLFGKYTPL